MYKPYGPTHYLWFIRVKMTNGNTEDKLIWTIHGIQAKSTEGVSGNGGERGRGTRRENHRAPPMESSVSVGLIGWAGFGQEWMQTEGQTSRRHMEEIMKHFSH